MDSFTVDPPPLVSAPPTVANPSPKRHRQRLAIVSTTNRLCGVGAYTAALRKQLDVEFDVTILDLDQYLLRGRHPRLKRLADQHIRQICERMEPFDAVNLQLEHGTLGSAAPDIYRRFRWLVAAARCLSVTFHTLPPPMAFPTAEIARSLRGFKPAAAVDAIADYRRNRMLSLKIARTLRRAQREKPVCAIAHNQRDHREIRHLYGIETVFDHPLAFLSDAEAAAIRARAARRDFPILDRIPAGARLIGVFGFLNDYKGLGTAIRALRHLTDDHHLLIFGGIHPNEITAGKAIHPYLATLYDEAYADATPYGEISAGQTDAAVRLVVEADRGLADLIGAHPRDVSARIHFMGAPDDADFLCGMASCDVVVFPYLEVGQSSSGPISQAVELGCRIIASRTHNFLGFADYHRDAIEFFDIGNYLELAERIRTGRHFPPRAGLPAYNTETNRAVYVAANTRRGADGVAKAMGTTEQSSDGKAP